MKIAVIGCGLRTPLLIHGLARADLGISQIVLNDIEPSRAKLMALLGASIAQQAEAKGTSLAVTAEPDLTRAVQDSSFVISSIRVGGMSARARDERVALGCGFAGQETTGPAGFAMALRTVPVAIEHARLVERVAPDSWIINFTNPAGLITQAISTHTGARVVGICDTPAELFFRIGLALDEAPENVECDYLGLNHLGWVRGIRARGEDVMERLLGDADRLQRLYPAPLFPPALIQSLGLIPTEYLFFYYRARTAMANQLSAGATRGEELLSLNERVLADLELHVMRGDTDAALNSYRGYLNRRNASYMRLEGSGESAFRHEDVDWDPFEGATGYHRIAVDAISGLTGSAPSRMILNVQNRGAIDGVGAEDVIEIPCWVDNSGARPIPAGPLPAAVRGLTLAVKTYESLTIQAAVKRNQTLATLALFTNPIVGDWDAAREFVENSD